MQLIRLRLLLLVLLTSIGIGAQAPAAFAVVDAAAPPDAVDDAETVRSGHDEFLALTTNDTDPDNDRPDDHSADAGIPDSDCPRHGHCASVQRLLRTSRRAATAGRTASTTRSRTETAARTRPPSRSRSRPTRPRPQSTTSSRRRAVSPSIVHVTRKRQRPGPGRGDFLTLTAPTPDVAMDTANGTRHLRRLRPVRVHLRRGLRRPGRLRLHDRRRLGRKRQSAT